MDQKRLEALLEEATIDCYGEEEEFTGVLYTLADNLNFPLRARAMSNLVEVSGLDDNQSSSRRVSWPSCARMTRNIGWACPS